MYIYRLWVSSFHLPSFTFHCIYSAEWVSSLGIYIRKQHILFVSFTFHCIYSAEWVSSLGIYIRKQHILFVSFTFHCIYTAEWVSSLGIYIRKQHILFVSFTLLCIYSAECLTEDDVSGEGWVAPAGAHTRGTNQAGHGGTPGPVHAASVYHTDHWHG